MEFPELITKIKQFHSEWRAHDVLIEDAASGQSAIQTLKRETSLPIRSVKVDRDKVSRAQAVTPLLESERVFLPQGVAWLDDYLDELSSFPNGAHDDMTDSTTQALNYLRGKGTLVLGLVEFNRRAKARAGQYDSASFDSVEEYHQMRVELGVESPEDQRLHEEQADRRRAEVEAHALSLQRPEETKKLADGSTVKWNRFLNCWQDIRNWSKTYPGRDSC